MVTLWKSLIVPHFDYGNVIWAKMNTQTDRQILEGPLRNFSRRVNGMSSLNYWQRLEKLKIHSIERRTERFMLFYTWKSMMNIVPNIGFITWNHPRKGKMIRYNKIRGNSLHMRSMKECSIFRHGPKLYNSLPKCLREWDGSFSSFKCLIDNFMSLIPDRPCLQGYHSNNYDLNGGMTNSIIHWIRNLDLSDWEPRPDPDAIHMYEDN